MGAGLSGGRILVGTRYSTPVQTAPKSHPSISKISTEFLSRLSDRGVALAHLLTQRLCMGSAISVPPLRNFMAYCRVTFNFYILILVTSSHLIIENVMGGCVTCMTYMATVNGVSEIRTAWTVSLNIIRMIKLRRMRWAGYVARMGKEEACTGFCWENLEERDQWGDPGLDGRIILR